MRSDPFWRFYYIGAAIVTLCAGMAGCSAESSTASAAHSNSAAVRPNAVQRDRIARARANTRWVGNAHHEAMKVVIAYVADSKSAKRKLPQPGSPAYCAVLEQAGMIALRELARHSAAVSQSDHRMRVESILAPECKQQRTPSVPGPTPIHTVSRPPYQDLEVTGQYEAFVPLLEEAVLGSDGSVWTIRDRLDLALAAAVSQNIAEGDLQALASFAGLIESSAEEWNAFDWSAYQNSDCDYGVCTPVSFPFAAGVGGKILAVIGADAVGCLSTVKSWSALKLLLGTAAPAALGGECGVRGAIASGGAVFTMLK